MRPQCIVPDCHRPASNLTHILCAMHYRRLMVNGDPGCATPQRIRTLKPLVDRFWQKVIKTDGCWPWDASTNKGGYGMISNEDGILAMSHRIAWKWASGQDIPEGMDVLHTCDNPPCVRNDYVGIYTVDGVTYISYGHLFLGTATTNGKDASAKGRLNPGGHKTSVF